MFNHYTPQSDGSYQRSTRPDPVRPAPRQPVSSPPPQSPPQCPPSRPQPCSAPAFACGVGGFLRDLLPRQIDTADLLVILLVLLTNRENGESAPLLTLALYFLL